MITYNLISHQKSSNFEEDWRGAKRKGETQDQKEKNKVHSKIFLSANPCASIFLPGRVV